MTDLRKAAEMALEALEKITRQFTKTPSSLKDSEARVNAHKAIGTLRQVLAQPEQEPVAWQYQEYRSAFMGNLQWFDEVQFVQPPNDPERFRNIKPLYTAPPSKPWVSLTSEELASIVVKHAGYSTRQLAAIEAALRSKNND